LKQTLNYIFESFALNIKVLWNHQSALACFVSRGLHSRDTGFRYPTNRYTPIRPRSITIRGAGGSSSCMDLL